MTNSAFKQHFTLRQLNEWRLHRQWLDRPFKGRSLLDLIRSIGWIYSPGCSTPYLSLWARTAKFRPATLDRLVFKDLKLVQLETLRGCTMLIPLEQAPIALRIRSRTFTELAKQARSMLPIKDIELERLKNAVVQSLDGGAKTHDEILNTVPSDLIREFPSDLKRVGLTGSLWLAINLLKEEGRLVKVQSTKRLDTSKYSFALLSELLPQVDPFELKPEHASEQLASHYFRSEGPARIKDFAWWAGINATDAMRAVRDVQPAVTRVNVAGTKDEFFIRETELEELGDFQPSDAPQVNFIPYRDVYLKGQREVIDRFLPPEHFDKLFSRWKGKLINDPLASVIWNGEIVGVWEWDTSRRGKLDFELFGKDIPNNIQALIRKRGRELSSFIRDNLGGVRLQGRDYGRHQMTRIRDLKNYWGQGAQVDVGVV